LSWRRFTISASSEMSKGASGTTIAVAPPAMPACNAIHPASRPMTSTTMMRSWLSAVVCSRSMASVAICTAVWKPKVASVPTTSLSMVLGTPTVGSPNSSKSRDATVSEPLPPMTTKEFSSKSRKACCTLATPSGVSNGPPRRVPKIVPPFGTIPRTSLVFNNE